MLMAIKAFRSPLLWLSIGMTWLLVGCSLLKYPTLNLLDFQQSPDAYGRGVHYYWDGLYKSAVKELATVPSDHPRHTRAQAYLKKANNHIAKATTHVNAALQYRKKGELFKAK